jgi:hypothetical protein
MVLQLEIADCIDSCNSCSCHTFTPAPKVFKLLMVVDDQQDYICSQDPLESDPCKVDCDSSEAAPASLGGLICCTLL